MKNVFSIFIVFITIISCFAGCSANHSGTGGGLSDLAASAEIKDTKNEETDDMQADKEDMPYKSIYVNTTFTDNMVLQRDTEEIRVKPFASVLPERLLRDSLMKADGKFFLTQCLPARKEKLLKSFIAAKR